MVGIYKKKVKKHEEVWFTDTDVDARVRVCAGNSNYGRLYYMENEERGQWLDEKETAEAFALFKEIWKKNKDYDPFGTNDY